MAAWLVWDYANRLEAQFKQDTADNMPQPEDMEVPKELNRRQDRLAVIAQAKQESRACAKALYEQEKAEYDEKLAQREKHQCENVKIMGGKTPAAPSEEPQAKGQVS